MTTADPQPVYVPVMPREVMQWLQLTSGLTVLDGKVMETHFRKHLKSVDLWLSGQSNLQLLYVDHIQLIQSPEKISASIREFLSVELDTEKMVSCVDPDLHRQKASVCSKSSLDPPC
jgi:hypothetical protein